MDLPMFVGTAYHWQQCQQQRYQNSVILCEYSTTLLRPYRRKAFGILSVHPVGSRWPYRLQTSTIARCITLSGHGLHKLSAVGKRRQCLHHIAAIVIA